MLTTLLDDRYEVHLAFFDGPLDLLLHLVRTHEVELRDVPLGKITGEYLDMIKFMDAVELEPASEFLEIAAALIRSKAQALLPSRTLGLDAEDMAAEQEALLEQLVEHQVVRMAAHDLRGREARAAAVWFRGDKALAGGEADETEVVEADLFVLVSAFRSLLEGIEAPRRFDVSRDEYPVSERVDAIQRRLESGEPIPFEELFEAGAPRGKLIATFLALLELIRSGEARAYQEQAFGKILVFPVAALEQQPATA